MFNKLKIYNAISLIIGFFAILLFVTIGYTLFNIKDDNQNFKRMVISSVNNNQMRDAAYNITAAMANVTGLMLQTARDIPMSDEMQKLTSEIMQQAQSSIDDFLASPFNTVEESQAAEEVNKAFQGVMQAVKEKQAFMNNPAGYNVTLEQQMAQRSLLREKIARYNDITTRLSDAYISKAESDYHHTIIVGILTSAVALIMLVIVRYWLRQTLVRRMEMTTAMLKRVAAGDLSQPVSIGQRNEIGLMLSELELMRTSLTDTILGIRESVNHIHHNAQEIAHGNNDLSSRTEEQAAALQQTAASMEEIKTTVRQNADNAHTARELAESASSSAQQGGNAMHSLEAIMVQITESSRRIADINGVIDSIANQTNILALNAAVEAARAGEQGRGFAVVAEEVRNLARRSAEAAKEINQLINTCVSNMDVGSRQVDQASVVMQEIVNSVAQVTQIMGEITSASDEQSAGINQISQAVNEMDLVTQQNAAMVEEAAMAANELESQSDALEKLVTQFVLSREAGDIKVAAVRNNRPQRATAAQNLDNAQWETF